jgi:mannitol/fructose-specific phosphotransferase system IIA component
MTNKQFIKYLTERNIPHKVAGKQITVLGGSVYLGSLTTLPEGIKFENQGYVYLRSLTTLPEGIKFENQGYVDLRSLTTLPEGIKFENQGYVELRSLTTLPEGIKFENQGYVELRSLTTLPEGIKFENQGSVYLGSLTTLPEGIKFENQGYVDLGSLTTLPEGIKFENQGSVYLGSLTTLPEGIKFENQGSVDLRSLTTLPEGIKFENQGYVYLRSLTNEKQLYLGKERVLRNIDGFTMLITSTRNQGDMVISNARYFGGGDIDKLKKCFVVRSGNFSAHGNTLKSAIEDVQFKLKKQAGKSEAIQRIKSTEIVTANDFRIITGACREGMRQHLAQRNIDMEGVESLTLSDAIKAMSGSSFGDQFIRELAAS